MTVMRSLDESVMRQPPSNIEAERALIGAVMLNNDAFRRVASIVQPRDFYEGVHRQIWEVTAAVIAKGQVATPITLKDYLGDADLGGGVTPLAYLARLSKEATTVLNAPDYAKGVRQASLMRDLITLGQTIISNAYDAPVEATAEGIFGEMQAEFEMLQPRMSAGRSDFRSFDAVADEAIDRMSQDWQNDGQPRGLTTGLTALDEMMGGLESPDLIILAGRTAMGKTALAVNITVAAAKELRDRRQRQQKKTGVVGFFSLEMGDTQLFDRMISAETGVPSWRIRRRKMSKEEFERVINTTRDLRGLPLHIDQTGNIPLTELISKARSLKKRQGLELLVVDYLQLIKGKPAGRDQNRSQEVGDIAATLKGLAKELQVPVIALSQVGRQVERQDNKRPGLSDLSESGAIENNADHVLFTYREEYYHDRLKPQEGTDAFLAWERRAREIHGVAEIIIGKNRHGRTGIITTGYRAEFTQFTNEVEPRAIEPEEVRQRAAKKPTFTAEGTVLYGILKSLTLTKSRIASNEQRAADKRLCKGARLIPLDDARQAFGNEVLPGSDDEKVNTRFRAAFVSLRKAEIAFYHGTQEAGFSVWLPELAADL